MNLAPTTRMAGLAALLGGLVVVTGCFNPTNNVTVTGADGSSDSGDGDASGDSGATSTGGELESETGEIGSTGSAGSTCGDGVVDEGEQCDLGTGNSESGTCTQDCLLAVCGDGMVLVGTEDCDDAGESATCNADCTVPSCGDGVHNLTAGEACDDGGDSETCNADCTQVSCGDGYINTVAGEQCEDEDGTNATCNACVLECNIGFGDCNGDVVSDGCETDTTTLTDCTACGQVCEGYPLCGEGGCARYAFITSTNVEANMGGLAGADAICQAHADAAGLGGTYMAWLSDAVDSPATRFTREGGPWVRVDGALIANSWDDLVDGELIFSLDVTEVGENPPDSTSQCGPQAVWTNTGPDGHGISSGSSCDNWTDTSSTSSAWGNHGSPNNWAIWCSGGTIACQTASPLYCFQQ